MSNTPYYRWFPSDWFGSLTRLRLTGSQTATYRDLIDRMMEGDGVWEVSVDDASLLLSTPFRSVAELKNDIETLIETGAIVSRGKTLRNARAQKEAKRRNDTSEKRKAAADSRWKKGQSNSDANAMQMHESCNAPPQSIVHSPQSIDPQSTVQKPEAKAIETNTTIMAATATNQPSPSQKKSQPKKPWEDTDAIDRLFNWWKKAYGFNVRKSTARKTALTRRMKEDGYTIGEVYCALAGYLFDSYEGRRNRQLGACEPHVLLRVKRDTQHDALEAGLQLYRENIHQASQKLPPEVALRSFRTYEQVGSSGYLYDVMGISDHDRDVIDGPFRRGEGDRYSWRRWARALLCEWRGGADTDKIAELVSKWTQGEDAPEPDLGRLPGEEVDWIINLGAVEGEG